MIINVMALLRNTDIAETKESSTSKGQKPSFLVTGQLAFEFNKAKEAAEAAEAKMKKARTKLLEAGIGHLYQHNIDHPAASVASIELTDVTGSNVILISQDRYSEANAEAAELLFESLGKKYPDSKIDINDYVQEAVSASFDSTVFNTGPDGQFTKKVFDAYAKAIAAVTTELIKKGDLPENTPSPLKTTKKVLPLDSFHSNRWALFPSVADQNAIRSVLPNTIAVKGGDVVEPKEPAKLELQDAPPAIAPVKAGLRRRTAS
jgi:hypothetical protein